MNHDKNCDVHFHYKFQLHWINIPKNLLENRLNIQCVTPNNTSASYIHRPLATKVVSGCNISSIHNIRATKS